MEKGLLEDYIKWDPNEYTKKKIQEISNKQELKDLLTDRISFGTAGLRAEMNVGYKNINDLVVMQTAQGICMSVLQELEKHPRTLKIKQGIAIAFDHRENPELRLSSKGFALISAYIFNLKNIPVFLIDSTVCATPILAYSVKRNKHLCGIMVTASHNPKEDNGYKVYWNNSCQIISPTDSEIAKNISNNLEPWDKNMPASYNLTGENILLKTSHNLENVLKDYYATIQSKLCFHLKANESRKLKITYTAMHGVGEQFVIKSFKVFNLPKFYTVKKQAKPDYKFPTVKFPNPEEGKESLDLAIETAEKHKCEIIIANDPDADRLAVAERKFDFASHPDNNRNNWRVFSGNEIGMLLGYWMYENNKNIMQNIAMVASTVSSKFLKVMAQKEGFEFYETLTGFKWIGNKALELKNQGKNVILGYEEAIGYCLGHDIVFDKDGVSAAAVISEMACYYRETSNLTFQQILLDLEKKYGSFCSNNGYIICHDKEKKIRLFEDLRETLIKQDYKISFGDKFKATTVRDLFPPGIDTSNSPPKPELPVSTSNKLMLTFTFDLDVLLEKQITFTLRASGTEPKIKYYCEMSGNQDKILIQQELDNFVESIVKNVILKSVLPSNKKQKN